MQAVQYYITSKGHCRFDVSKLGFKFIKLYNFSELEDRIKSDIKGIIKASNCQKETVASLY